MHIAVDGRPEDWHWMESVLLGRGSEHEEVESSSRRGTGQEDGS